MGGGGKGGGRGNSGSKGGKGDRNERNGGGKYDIAGRDNDNGGGGGNGMDYGGWKENQQWNQESWDNWQGYNQTYDGAHTGIVVQSLRPLAAQWRFACRVLKRHSPEERVYDPRRQLALGDHIVAHSSWDQSAAHGIICSADESYGRRGERGEAFWVIHYTDQELQCTALSQFSRNSELYVMRYPLWICQCYVPASSTARPHIEDERLLQPVAGDQVAKKANSSHRGRSWSPSWSQAHDLEFCLSMKISDMPQWELHDRAALSSMVLPAIGCAFKGSCQPSQVFSAQAAHKPPPGYSAAGGQGVQQWAPMQTPQHQMHGHGQVPQSQMMHASDVEAFQQSQYPAAAVQNFGGHGHEQPGWQWSGDGPSRQRGPPQVQPQAVMSQMQQQPQMQQPQMQMMQQMQQQMQAWANSGLSANAQVFVPQDHAAPQQPSWDGVYQ